MYAEVVDAPPEPDHDPLRHPPGGVPATVLIGLALLPFLIPILWMVAPVVLGKEPSLSIAVPISLAVSVSILCLAVIYTIDWSPALRVKGVLTLVSLAYFAGVTLFFAKPEIVQKIREFFGDRWIHFHPQGADYSVRLPRHPVEIPNENPVGNGPFKLYRCEYRAEEVPVTFSLGSARVQEAQKGPKAGSDAWYEQVSQGIVERSGGKLEEEPKVITNDIRNIAGRELVIDLKDEGKVRVVRFFYSGGTLYYLAVEGPSLPPADPLVLRFFTSFVPNRIGG
jgi:hypothetical protein